MILNKIPSQGRRRPQQKLVGGEEEPAAQYETQRIKGKEGVVVCDNIVLTEAEAGYWTPSSITHFTL